MTDPMNTDPRLVDPPVPPDERRNAREMKEINSTWGWIAGAIVVLMLVLLIFGNVMNPSNTAGLGDQNTPSRTSSTPAPQNPSPPSTTGQRTQ
jgi:hypothetical protein